MRTFFRDFLRASRLLLRKPGFAIPLVLTFAVGIGLNTALFSVVYAVLLKPLPYPHPGELFNISEVDEQNAAKRQGASAPDFLDWRKQQASFAALEGYRLLDGSLTDPGDKPEHVVAGQVTAGFFSLFGTRPVLGRTFQAEEDLPGGERVVVLSHSLWQQRYGRSKEILGKLLSIDDKSYRVVGVLPPSFVSPTGRDEVAWVPLQPAADASRQTHDVRVFARARPGVSQESAQSEMATIMKRLEATYPKENKGQGAQVSSLYEDIVGNVRKTLLTLFAVVGTVLLIACVNITGLFLAYILETRREVALQAALGSTRLRVLSKLLAEALFLALVGGCLGTLLAVWGVKALVTLGPQNLPRLAGVTVDGTVVAFSFLVTLLAGLACGVVPAVQASSVNLQTALKDGGRSSTGGAGRRQMRNLLVVLEVALAVVLVIQAGLLVKSFYRLLQVDLGFEPDRVLTLEVTLPKARYPAPSQDVFPRWPELQSFYSRVLEQVSAVPGVQKASIAGDHPLHPGWTTHIVVGKGTDATAADNSQAVRLRPTGPDFFKVTGTRLLQGRDFDPRDNTGAPLVLIANAAFVRQYFPGQNPLGQQITFWNKTREIVGVVQDVRFMGLGEDVPPALYAPFLQTPLGFFNIVLKTRGKPESVIPAVRTAIWSVDPSIAIYNVSTMSDLASKSVALPRFSMLLVSLFALVATFLAAVGIYSQMANSIAKRTSEFGVRMALGCQRQEILQLVLGEVARLLAVGLVLGLGLAFATNRLIGSLLFQVNSFDPLIFVCVALLLAAVGLLASLVPVMRATRVSPVAALRYE